MKAPIVGPEGRRWEGSDAVEQVLRLVPYLRPLSRLFRIPLARPVARVLYRLFAKNRQRFGCGDHCPVV